MLGDSLFGLHSTKEIKRCFILFQVLHFNGLCLDGFFPLSQRDG